MAGVAGKVNRDERQLSTVLRAYLVHPCSVNRAQPVGLGLDPAFHTHPGYFLAPAFLLAQYAFIRKLTALRAAAVCGPDFDPVRFLPLAWAARLRAQNFFIFSL